MNKFRNVPAMITLLSGFVVSVFMIVNRTPILRFMWTLLSVMIVFFIVGLIVRFIFNKIFADPIEEEEAAEVLEEALAEDAVSEEEASDAELTS